MAANCIHCHGIMQRGMVKRMGPVMAWPESQHTLGRPVWHQIHRLDWRCYADTLQIWFPAHWAPFVLRQLQHKEDEYRAANPLGWTRSHLLSMLVLLLWHRGCLSDITGALFCCLGTINGWFPVSLLCVAFNGLFACFCQK